MNPKKKQQEEEANFTLTSATPITIGLSNERSRSERDLNKKNQNKLKKPQQRQQYAYQTKKRMTPWMNECMKGWMAMEQNGIYVPAATLFLPFHTPFLHHGTVCVCLRA
jgi:hypothetical protein